MEYWIGEYPSDFTVKGAHGALSAFIKQTLLHSHIMHYGADLRLSMEKLQKWSDVDASWSVKAEDSAIGSDESDGIPDDLISDESEDTKADPVDSSSPLINSDTAHAASVIIPARERKSSLPLTKTFLSKPPSSPSMGRSYSSGPTSSKELLFNLQRISIQLLSVDSDSIAREISRNDSLNFMKIQVSSLALASIQSLNLIILPAAPLVAERYGSGQERSGSGSYCTSFAILQLPKRLVKFLLRLYPWSRSK